MTLLLAAVTPSPTSDPPAASAPPEADAATAIPAAIRALLPELEVGETPITHELLMRLLVERKVPASRRTYFKHVTKGSVIAEEIKTAQKHQAKFAAGTPLARARDEATRLRARIAELEAANRVLLLERAAMVKYLMEPPANVPQEVVARAQRHALGASLHKTPFARRALRGVVQASVQAHLGRGGQSSGRSPA